MIKDYNKERKEKIQKFSEGLPKYMERKENIPQISKTISPKLESSSVKSSGFKSKSIKLSDTPIPIKESQ